MLFNSFEYLVFFVVVFLFSWRFVGIPKLRLWFLLLASYYFYASNNGWLLVLILGSTAIDYIAAINIERAVAKKQKKLWLLLSIGSNLSILGFFKYFNFFMDTVELLVSQIGYELSYVDLNIILPVGISFYTFQTMSYSIDVYRGHLKAERSLLRFAFFVTYFPQLVAGPIVRPHDFLPQLDTRPKLNLGQLEFALLYISKGLIKKIVLGDFIGQFADEGFNNPDDLDFISALFATYCFTFQIYFDFSGYSDVAIGCSRLLGYHIPENFRRPYISINITDFWRRWHISLSSWLRDYLYISLGGNRTKTKFGTYKNLMVTMLLGGLWHGAAWHFILWGGVQGLFLSFEKLTGIASLAKKKFKRLSLQKALLLFITFHLVCFSWIIFRCEDGELRSFLQAFGNLPNQKSIPFAYPLLLSIFVVTVLAQYLQEKYDWYSRFLEAPFIIKIGVYSLSTFLILFFSALEAQPFIYFQF